jgi:hypothetical protein
MRPKTPALPSFARPGRARTPVLHHANLAGEGVRATRLKLSSPLRGLISGKAFILWTK